MTVKTNMQKIASTDNICTTKPDEEVKQNEIFTPTILIPITLIGLFVGYGIPYMHDELYNDALLPDGTYSDPFKRVWWSGPIFFTFVYLLMVVYGVRYMNGLNLLTGKSQAGVKPIENFKIEPYVFTYNLYQCLLNLWTVIEMIREVSTNSHFTGIWGNTTQRSIGSFRISFLVWLHYNNKYFELLDTVWMVLRKKNDQVSFLHCYHHILLIWSWFFVCKVESGGDCYFGACVNSFIHVIMYGYYTIALLKIECPWKKYITNCQMAQFCLCFLHSCYVVYKGNMTITLPLLQAFVMVNMLVLFSQFAKKKYTKKPLDVAADNNNKSNKVE